MRECFDLFKNYWKYIFFELFYMNKRCFYVLMYDLCKYFFILFVVLCYIIFDIILDG